MSQHLILALQSVLLLLLLSASAFFSGSETALFSLSAEQLQSLGKNGVRGRRLVDLLKQPTHLLSTLLIGNTLVNVVIATLGYRIIDSFPSLGRYSALVAVPAMTILLLIFGEVAPKRTAVAHAEDFALRVATPLHFCSKLFAPLRFCLEFFSGRMKRHLRPERRALTDDELLTAVEVGAEQGVLDQDERSMVDGIFRLDEMTASDVMTPRVDFEGIDLDLSPEERLDIARKTDYHYLPVYRGTPDAIEGFLDVAAFLLDPSHNFNEALDFPLFVPETATLDDLLVALQRNRRHVACVMDEYGGTAGLITRSDILEVFADLPLDPDEKPDDYMRRVDDTHWLIDGDTSLEEINHELDLELEAEGADRIAGWVTAQAGRFPRIGETVEAQGCRVQVKHRRKLRINQVLLEILPKELEDVDEEGFDDEDDATEEEREREED
ncbi:MAG: HlyC/CorC family transporter [Kiritimatiellae bacterium]|nr:HlyC/CorC family transporter [Kiritimatiellia bacterium]